MQCYVGGRRTGKTQHLINLSHDTGFPIVTATVEMAHSIERQALKMGKSIPVPYCYKSPAARVAMKYEHVLIDEAQTVLDSVFETHVVAASICGEALANANPALGNLEEMGLLDLLHAWRKAKKGKR